MKKLILSTLAAIAVFSQTDLAAQAPPAYPLYFADSQEAPAAMMPYTTVKIYLTVEKETVKTGPYARYAQKYLGVMAPLADRDTYEITSARLDYADPDRNPAPAANVQQAGRRVVSHIAGGEEFTRFQPDRVSMSDRSTEDMARDAANTIFQLRRQRLEILTGETGELYMGGLEAALAEISRLENEYLALFLGKQTVETMVHEIEVVPQSGKNSYIACRFSDTGGILPDSDLSGQPVVLAVTAERAVASMAPRSDKRQTQLYRVADFAECKLSYGQQELAKKRIPVYQFGVTVTGPAVSK